MRLSQAILLGSTLLRPVAGDLELPGDCGALGMAERAVGAGWSYWPWLLTMRVEAVDWADGGGWWSEPSLGSISSAVCVWAMKSGLTSMKHFWPWRALSSAGRFCKGTAVESA